MKIIEEHIDGDLFESAVFNEYFGGMRLVVADIETTGLSPKNAAVILGGAVFADDGSADPGKDQAGYRPPGTSGSAGRRAVQFFADSVGEERELLERYAGLLSQFDAVVTYNGRQFDLPFMKKRMRTLGLDASGLEGLYSIDMYRWLKYHSHLPKILPDMRQKSVEAYLGDAGERTDEIDGGESVELYYKYVTTDDRDEKGRLLDFILLHNRDDIVRLSDMMRIIKKLDLHEIVAAEGFTADAGDARMVLKSAKLTKGWLRAGGQVIRGAGRAYRIFGEDLTLDISAEGDISLEIATESYEDYTVADLRKLGLDEAGLSALGGYESGYLILAEGRELHSREINTLIRAVLSKALQ